MLAPRPPAAWASSSAFTSFRVRPTTWKRFSRSARRAALAARLSLPAPGQRRAQLPQQPFVPDDKHRLIRFPQQVEELPAIGSRVDLVAVGQQLNAAAATGRLEQPRAELRLECR